MEQGRWAVSLGAYGAMTAAAIGFAVYGGRWPSFGHPDPWFELNQPTLVSLGLGLALGGLTVGATRLLVATTHWARALRTALRSLLGTVSVGEAAALAVLSGVAEELFFRGVLQPMLGLVGTSLLFGSLHVGPGRAFWPWTVWAIAMGFALGALYEGTGSIAGPVAAHVLVNFLNLRAISSFDSRLDDHDGPAPQRLVSPARRG